MKPLNGFLILLLMFLTLTACNIVVQEAPDETVAPEKEAAVFSFSEEWQERQALIPVALGEEAADLVVINASAFVSQTGEFMDNWVIAAKGRRIAYFGPQDEPGKSSELSMIDTLIGPDTIVINAEGQTAVPGFGHSHNHIESSRLTPTRWEEVVLPLGTTWIIEGDHENCNVLAETCIDFWLDMKPRFAKVFPAVTSQVPPSDEFMEPTGGYWGYSDVVEQFNKDVLMVHSLGEVYYEPGIQDPNSPAYNRLHQNMQAAYDLNQPIQGHTGGPGYSNIATFRNVAIRTTHNPRTDDHTARVARINMWHDLASNRANFDENVKGAYAHGGPYTPNYVTLSTDDRDLPELIHNGDMDYNVRRYIAAAWEGIETGEIDITKERAVIDALRASSYNPALVLRLDDEVGSFSPGAFADIILLNGQSVEEIALIDIDTVIASGELAVSDGVLISEVVAETPAYALDTVSLKREVTPEDFAVTVSGERDEVEAWLWRPFDFRPRPDIVTLPVKDGIVQYGGETGIYKMANIERHLSISPNDPDEIQMGIMFTATSPSKGCSAVATTVMHDAHQLGIHGNCDEAMAIATNRLIELGGGFVVVEDGEILAEIALPVYGMMSNDEPEILLEQMEVMREASDSLEWVGTGSRPGHPTDSMTFWFLTPAPWPWNVTSRGIFDLFTGEELPIVW